jgi:hypothetical protein
MSRTDRSSEGTLNDPSFLKGAVVGAVAHSVLTSDNNSNPGSDNASGCIGLFVTLFLVVFGFAWGCSSFGNMNGTPDREPSGGRLLVDMRPSENFSRFGSSMARGWFHLNIPAGDSFVAGVERRKTVRGFQNAPVIWICADDTETAQNGFDILTEEFGFTNVELWPSQRRFPSRRSPGICAPLSGRGN